jgi:hypothetical protein
VQLKTSIDSADQHSPYPVSFVCPVSNCASSPSNRIRSPTRPFPQESRMHYESRLVTCDFHLRGSYSDRDVAAARSDDGH